jgi:hypothetical protein
LYYLANIHEIVGRSLYKGDYKINLRDRADLSTRDKSVAPKVSLVGRFHCRYTNECWKVWPNSHGSVVLVQVTLKVVIAIRIVPYTKTGENRGLTAKRKL